MDSFRISFLTCEAVLFLNRLLPGASWTDIFVRDELAYEREAACEWATGACLLVRRSALEAVDGFDERFFLYCEDVDLCRRLHDAGWSLLYEPAAVAVHRGSWEVRADRLPYLAASRIEYARKHDGRLSAALQTIGVRLEALTRLLVSRGGLPARLGHARSLTGTPRLGRS